MKPFITVRELLADFESKKYTPKEAAQYFTQRINKFNPTLNAVLETFESEQTTATGPLAGVPGAIKNIISIKGKRTTCGSNVLKNYTAPMDATVTARLKNAGGVILAATNCDEFAMGASGEFSAFGPAKNPWDLTRTPGGSSSGSVTAVTAGLVPWALGTETGGSVRQPAAFCGLVGMYPTYGLFPRYGIVAFASSNDQAGPFTHTVYDNALIASILAGKDPMDSTSLDVSNLNFTKNLTGKMPKITIGVLDEALTSSGVDPEVKASFEQAIKQLESLGATIKRISVPSLKYALSVYFIVAYAEGASNLARFDGTLYGNRTKDAENLFDMYAKTRNAGLGKEVKRRILLGNYVLSSAHKEAYYDKATQIRNALRADFDAAFKDVDLITSPTTATPAFKLGELCADPLAIYMNDYFTIPNNITGMPALSLPCGFTKSGLPIGFQFIGPRLSEDLIFQTAHAYEQSTEHHLKHPAGYEQ